MASPDENTTTTKAGDVANEVRNQAAAAASDFVQPMKERAREIGEEQKRAGADRLGDMARAVHQAADQLQPELPPQARTYIHQAADGLEHVSSAIRDRSIGDLLQTLGDFAHRQPVAFLGGSVLAGFVLSRFLKSSAETGAGASRGVPNPGAPHSTATS